MIIAKDRLTIPENPFNSGSFSNVYKVELDGETYCYKEFTRGYPDDIVMNIVSMTKEKFSSEYLTPLFMVLKEDGSKFSGYLTEYNDKLRKMDRKKNILLLKQARKTIKKFHEEYNRIHGDLTITNMLFDDNDKAYLLDFDSSLKITQKLGSNNSFLWPVKEFLRLYPLDYNVDAYIFNITTLAVLNNIDLTNMLRQMARGQIMVPELNSKVKKLSNELLIRDTRKPYSGEYIIDYV